MRDIKFRAWDKKSKTMGYTEPLQIGGDYIGPNLAAWFEGMDFPERDVDGVIMQYTGLKDKNDVEIYEGDILQDKSWPDDNKALGVMTWENWGWSQFHPLERFEIIGNIYENPELLK